MLQHDAVCCSMMQCASCCNTLHAVSHGIAQYYTSVGYATSHDFLHDMWLNCVLVTDRHENAHGGLGNIKGMNDVRVFPCMHRAFVLFDDRCRGVGHVHPHILRVAIPNIHINIHINIRSNICSNIHIKIPVKILCPCADATADVSMRLPTMPHSCTHARTHARTCTHAGSQARTHLRMHAHMHACTDAEAETVAEAEAEDGMETGEGRLSPSRVSGCLLLVRRLSLVGACLHTRCNSPCLHTRCNTTCLYTRCDRACLHTASNTISLHTQCRYSMSILNVHNQCLTHPTSKSIGMRNDMSVAGMMNDMCVADMCVATYMTIRRMSVSLHVHIKGRRCVARYMTMIVYYVVR